MLQSCLKSGGKNRFTVHAVNKSNSTLRSLYNNPTQGILNSLHTDVSLLSVQAPSFYWEIEVVSYGDSEDDSGPIVSFGFATEAEKRDGAWTNPVGTCLFHKYAAPVSNYCPLLMTSFDLF